MRLNLKEEPREWIKFTAVWMVAFTLLSLLFWRRGWFSGSVLLAILVGLSLILLLSFVKPVLFRPVYRAVMTATFHVGQVVGKVLLTVFFFGCLTPLSILLRLLGKDPLHIRRRPAESSYWHKAKPFGPLDRLF